MKLKLTILLSVLAALVVIAVAGIAASTATARSMHGCHHYCAWLWADDGSGGGWWCGQDHNGDIVYRWNGSGYRCNWNDWAYGDGVHHGYWTSGY